MDLNYATLKQIPQCTKKYSQNYQQLNYSLSNGTNFTNNELDNCPNKNCCVQKHLNNTTLFKTSTHSSISPIELMNLSTESNKNLFYEQSDQKLIENLSLNYNQIHSNVKNNDMFCLLPIQSKEINHDKNDKSYSTFLNKPNENYAPLNTFNPKSSILSKNSISNCTQHVVIKDRNKNMFECAKTSPINNYTNLQYPITNSIQFKEDNICKNQ